MKIFNISQKNDSSVCLKALIKIRINKKELTQIQYITQNYVLTDVEGRKILFLPEKNRQYLVDIENKQLKGIDLSAQMMQMNQLKVMIGEINISEKQEDASRHIAIQNHPECPAKLDVEIQIIEYPEIEKTAFTKFNEFQQNLQLFSVKLKPNEIVKSSKSVFSVYGQEQKTSMELIEIMTTSDSITEIEAYLNFKIINK